jgi:hypothetical protein
LRAVIFAEATVRRAHHSPDRSKSRGDPSLAALFIARSGGEIAALKIGDVINQHDEVRSEIKLGAHQTKGTKGRTVILSGRVRREIGAYSKSQSLRHLEASLNFFPAESPIFFQLDAFHAVQGNLRDGRRSHVLSLRPPNICPRLNANAVELFDVWGRSIWNELSSPRKKGRSAIGVKRTSLLTANVRF